MPVDREAERAQEGAVPKKSAQGVDALRAVLLQKLEQTLGPLPEAERRRIEEISSVVELARMIAAVRGGGRSSVPPIARRGEPETPSPGRPGAAIASIPVGARADRATALIVPVSFSQRRLWLLAQLDPGSVAYNMPLAVRLHGLLLVPALAGAFQELVRRQGSLRTRFTTVGEEPHQVVDPAGPVALPMIDLSALPPDPRSQAVRGIVAADAALPFDLERGPLFRPRLVAVAPDEHLLLATLHHIVSDGWSMTVFRHEIAALYRAAALGLPTPFPELPIQYTDYAAWQRQRLQGSVLEAELDYWRGRLAGAPAGLDLPMPAGRPARETSRGAVLSVVLPEQLAGRLKRLAAEHGASLFMLLLAALKALIHRYTGATDLVIGSPIAGRNRRETEGLIGFFLNTLALRTDLSGDPPFLELLERVRETTLGAYEHQEVPFEHLFEELKLERDLSRNPLFQVMLNWLGSGEVAEAAEGESGGAAAAEGLSLETVSGGEITAKLDFEIYAAEVGSRIDLRLVYNRDLFEARQIESLAAHLESMLGAIAASPGLRLSELPLQPPEERRPVLPPAESGSFPAAALAGSVFERFLAVTERQGERPAVRIRARSWTYAELAAEAVRVAFALACDDARSGAGAGAPVALLFHPGAPMLAAILGALAAGRAYVPLDPAYPRERLATVLADSGAPLLLTESGTDPAIGQLAGGLARGRVVRLDWEELPPVPSGWMPPPVPGEALAYLLYTSGSTGLPKGVMQSQASVLAHARTLALRLSVEPEDRWALLASYSFDAAVMDIFGALLSGAELCPWDVRADGIEGIAGWLTEYRITLFHATPTLFRATFEAAASEAFSDLRAVVLGGEEAQPRDLELFRRIAGPDALLVNGLGPTESTLALQSSFQGDSTVARASLTVGRPVEETAVLLYHEGGEQVALWGIGEILLRSPYLAVGYWRRPAETAAAFVPDPEGGPLRVYRTGDLGRLLPDGGLEFVGRRDFQVKVRGVRVELGEIEAELRAHPWVRDAVVLVRTDARGEASLVACAVQRAEGPTLSAGLGQAVRRHLMDRLPPAAVPAAVVFFPELPLTATHKVDRRALLALLPREAPAAPAVAEAPQGPVEEMVAGIWAEVLGVEEVFRQSDFFELGGHSLSATRVISRVNGALGVAVPLRALFEEPGLAGFAERVGREMRRERGIEAPPLVPRPEALRRRVPLSFAQQRLWFLDQLEPGGVSYNLPTALRWSGPLDVAALRGALSEIVRRHESLRTSFAPPGDGVDEPLQVVHPAVELTLPLVDLERLGSRAEGEAIRLAGADAATPFDLAHGPLFRCFVQRLASREHAFVSTLHHIVSDGWSTGVLVREMAALYGAFHRGMPSPLPELPVQYADFAVWQRGWLAGETLAAEIESWRRQLAGLPAGLELSDRPRPPVQTHSGGLRPVRLSTDVTAGIQGLARAAGATPFMLLLGAWAELLGRHARQDDVALGSPIAGRNRIETEGLIGFFANTLVLRTDLSGRPSFRQVIERVRSVTLEAYAHQDVPFEKLVEELHPERSLSLPPFFQVLFVLQNIPQGGLELPGVTLGSLGAAGTGTAKFDLTLTLGEHAGRLNGAIEYNTDLFDAATVDRWIANLGNLLEAALAAPDQPLAELEMLGDGERAQILALGRERHPAAQVPVHHLVARQAAATPDRIAVVWEGGRLSYGELDSRAERLADRLVSAGVGPDLPVGVLAERSPGLAVGFLAVLKAGGAYLPLDPAYPADRLAFMLEDAAAPVVLAQARLAEGSPALRSMLHDSGTRVLLLDQSPSPEERSPARTRVEPVPDNLCYLVYTSGSTGKPKGCALPYRVLANLMAWQVATSRSAITLQFASPSFDVSLQETLSTWADGGTLVLATEEMRQEPFLLTRWLVEQGVERLFLPYVALQQLAEQFTGGRPLPQGLRVTEVATAGERLQVTAPIAALFERLPGAVLKNHYGPSETHVVTEHRLAGSPAGWPVLPPIGGTVWATRAYVVDRDLRLADVGMLGELLLGGVGVARGYLGRPGLTAEQFIPDPFSGEPGERLYRSGDLVRLRPDGAFDFLARVDLQVKIRGYRIEPEEIEVTLASHPEVRECAVVVREDRPGDRRLAAYYVPAGAEIAVAALRAHLGERLPEYMVPALFTPLPEIPLTGSGKVDRAVLAQLPVPEAAVSSGASMAPRNPIEELLAGAFRDVLGAAEVGIHDDFFELGGHSLLATRVTSRIRDAFGIELPVVALFEEPTVAGLGVRVTSALRRVTSPAVAPPFLAAAPADRSAPAPLSFGQERLLAFHRARPSSPVYNLSLAVRLSGALDRGALTAALRGLVGRHEVLRTTFSPGLEGEERPVQVVAPAASAASLAVPLIDLSALEESAEEEARRLLSRDARAPFDLTRGPLLRPTMLFLAPGLHLLSAPMHHIVSDGWSIGLLLRELPALYGAALAGLPSPLAPVPFQYADFARWQRLWFREGGAEADLDYWRHRLAGLPSLLALPTDRPRPPVRTLAGATLPVAWSGELAERVRRLALAANATPFMVLLAGLMTVLSQWAGQEDLAVGTAIAGRNRSEVEGVIGFFVNGLVLRGDLGGEPTFAAFLAQVRQTTLEAYAHQDLPLVMLVADLLPEPSPAHPPLFQVMFVLQNQEAGMDSLPAGEISPGLAAERVGGGGTGTAKYELTWNLVDARDGFFGGLEYNTDLFEAATAHRLLEQFTRLLEVATDRPEEKVVELARLAGVAAA
jgi:amino acid adenylation domain-containing protein